MKPAGVAHAFYGIHQLVDRGARARTVELAEGLVTCGIGPVIHVGGIREVVENPVGVISVEARLFLLARAVHDGRSQILRLLEQGAPGLGSTVVELVPIQPAVDEAVVVVGVEQMSRRYLLELRRAVASPRSLARPAERRQQHRRQNGDDCDNYKKFNKSK